MKLYVMSNGFADDFPREMMAATGAPVDVNDCITIPSPTFLIDHPDMGYVLYDTGWSLRKPATFELTPEDNIVNTLDRIGVKPEEINYLILSHLHFDHAGNIEPFINAEFIVSEKEFFPIAAQYFQKTKIESPYWNDDVLAWAKCDFKWRLIKGEYELVDFAEGIKLITLGEGHAFGILALLVQLPKYGNVIFASDAIYAGINIGPPRVPPGVIMNPEGWHRSVDFLEKIAEEYNAELWYGHDLEQFETLTKAEDGYYE